MKAIIISWNENKEGYFSLLCIYKGFNAFKANQLSNILLLLER